MIIGDIIGGIGQLLKPVNELVDNLTTTDEEKEQLHNQLQEIQNNLTAKMLEYETKLLETKADIVKTEAQGESWLQKNWRPITMLTFLGLLLLYWFGVHPSNLTQDTINHLFNLLGVGIGGYIFGRSGEKIVKHLKGK